MTIQVAKIHKISKNHYFGQIYFNLLIKWHVLVAIDIKNIFLVLK